MRLVITGGGTGGHVYPALSVVEALRRSSGGADIDIRWVGSANSIEQRLAQRDGLAFAAVSTGAFRGRNPLQALVSATHMVRGVLQAWSLIRSSKTDVVLATGGFVSAPVVLGAWLARCPVVIYLPDVAPGLAIRSLSRFARRVAVSFDSVAGYFAASKAVVTGYPVRQELFQLDHSEALRRLGWPDVKGPIILALGGSQGAHSINEAIRANLGEYLSAARLIHVCGSHDYETLSGVRNSLSSNLQERYLLAEYMHDEMTSALAAADLIVARAGAATLGEFPAVGAASILVPYPYSGEHQMVNAEYLASHGASIIVRDADLGARLLPTVMALLENSEERQAMATAARRLAVPDAAERIADELRTAARTQRREH